MSMNWISTSSWSSFARPTSKMTSCAVVLHDHVAGVQVGVDEAVLEAHLEQRHAHGLGELVAYVGAGAAARRPSCRGRTPSSSTRSRAQLGVAPRGSDALGLPAKFVAEPLVVLGLDAQVGLVVDRLDEVPRVADRIVEPPLRVQRDDARAAEQDRLVALDLAAHAGAQHLDRDLAAVA